MELTASFFFFSVTDVSSTLFANELTSVLVVGGREVPSGLQGSVTFLPSYVGLYSEKVLEYEFAGCADAPQIANSGAASTCAQTEVEGSCTMECASEYEWPLTAGPTCMTSDGFWEVLADCVPSGSTVSVERVAVIVLLVTPPFHSESYFTSRWAHSRVDTLEDVLAGLLNVDSDDVQASVVSPVTSWPNPFNITFLVLDNESLSHDLAEKLVCAVANCTDGEVVRQTLPGTTQVYALSGSLASQTNTIYTEALLSALERDDQWVPSGLASATVGLPKYVAVIDEFALTAWIVGAWSSCSNSCGEGNQTRNVYCSLGSDSACASSSSKPDVLQKCVYRGGCDDPDGPFFSLFGLPTVPSFLILALIVCAFALGALAFFYLITNPYFLCYLFCGCMG